MKNKDDLRLIYALPPINLSALAVKVMEAVKQLQEYEAVHGPISKKGKKKNKRT